MARRVPNTLFAFVKTSNSFHGVEPIQGEDIRRDVMRYDIRLKTLPQPAKAAVKFSF